MKERSIRKQIGKYCLFVVLMVLFAMSVVGCSNPKRDALPTNIYDQMDNGNI